MIAFAETQFPVLSEAAGGRDAYDGLVQERWHVRVGDVHQVVRDLEGRVMTEQTVQHVYVIEDGLVRRMEIRK